VEANNDATLDELRCHLEQQTRVLIGRSTVDRMLRLLNLSVKKNTLSLLKKEVSGFNHYEYNFGKQFREFLPLTSFSLTNLV